MKTFRCPMCGSPVAEEGINKDQCYECNLDYSLKENPFYGKGLSELIKSTKPFLMAADLVMLREMRIGTGIKLQEAE